MIHLPTLFEKKERKKTAPGKQEVTPKHYHPHCISDIALVEDL